MIELPRKAVTSLLYQLRQQQVFFIDQFRRLIGMNGYTVTHEGNLLMKPFFLLPPILLIRVFVVR
jgi:hypothetical protein